MSKAIGPRGGRHSHPGHLKMKQAWRTAAWKARVKELLLAHERCEWCNGKSEQVNHKRTGWYPAYALCLRDDVDVICKACHKQWTKIGIKSQRRYDDCSECAAPVFIGKRRCPMCDGEVVVSKTDFGTLPPEKRKTFAKILLRCPDVRVGDRWNNVWAWPDEVKVTGFEEQPDLPWPLVKTTAGAVGLPAFMFAEMVKKGTGKRAR